MRKLLGKFEGQRLTFVATFKRYGVRRGWRGQKDPTILLVDIRHELDVELCDHLWVKVGKRFLHMDLQEGDKIKFNARVVPYVKGYNGFREGIERTKEKDWKISHPTNIQKL